MSLIVSVEFCGYAARTSFHSADFLCVSVAFVRTSEVVTILTSGKLTCFCLFIHLFKFSCIGKLFYYQPKVLFIVMNNFSSGTDCEFGKQYPRFYFSNFIFNWWKSQIMHWNVFVPIKKKINYILVSTILSYCNRCNSQCQWHLRTFSTLTKHLGQMNRRYPCKHVHFDCHI